MVKQLVEAELLHLESIRPETKFEDCTASEVPSGTNVDVEQYANPCHLLYRVITYLQFHMLEPLLELMVLDYFIKERMRGHAVIGCTNKNPKLEKAYSRSNIIEDLLFAWTSYGKFQQYAWTQLLLQQKNRIPEPASPTLQDLLVCIYVGYDWFNHQSESVKQANPLVASWFATMGNLERGYYRHIFPDSTIRKSIFFDLLNHNEEQIKYHKRAFDRNVIAHIPSETFPNFYRIMLTDWDAVDDCFFEYHWGFYEACPLVGENAELEYITQQCTTYYASILNDNRAKLSTLMDRMCRSEQLGMHEEVCYITRLKPKAFITCETRDDGTLDNCMDKEVAVFSEPFPQTEMPWIEHLYLPKHIPNVRDNVIECMIVSTEEFIKKFGQNLARNDSTTLRIEQNRKRRRAQRNWKRVRLAASMMQPLKNGRLRAAERTYAPDGEGYETIKRHFTDTVSK